jgi:hypothetical protein
MTGLPLSRTIATALVIGLTGTVSAGYLLHSELPDLYLCDWQPMTAAQVAAHRGIDPHMLEQLHHNRSLDVSQVCDMPEAKLKRALYRVNNPKPDHPGDWAKQRRMQMQDENGRIPDNALVKAHEQLNAMLAAQQAASPNQDPEVKAINKSNWAWIGPKNIGGRIRSILVHPNSPNTMYIGSVSGGIWKTTNGGTSWKILSDFMAGRVRHGDGPEQPKDHLCGYRRRLF